MVCTHLQNDPWFFTLSAGKIKWASGTHVQNDNICLKAEGERGEDGWGANGTHLQNQPNVSGGKMGGVPVETNGLHPFAK